MGAASQIKPNRELFEGQFLDWFIARRLPLIEHKLELGGLSYYQFQSHFQVADGRSCVAFGSHPDRRTALLKCASESVEREVMVDYFLGHPEIPAAFRNSNGWAVHLDASSAKISALNEALERHLLLKSFFTFGWNGFNFHQKISFEDTTALLLTSRFEHDGKLAGLVVSQSSKFAGVSFGYCVGKMSDLQKTSFWQGGIFESLGKILFSGDLEKEINQDSWINEGINHYLQAAFDTSALQNLPNREVLQCSSELPQIELIDLQNKLNLDFPLFAARAFGPEILPLFNKMRLDDSALKYLEPILSANEIHEIPERHPIL